ncbi:hypothetical protein VTK26DRAFT_9410 [Humicola hyalothermophila]
MTRTQSPSLSLFSYGQLTDSQTLPYTILAALLLLAVAALALAFEYWVLGDLRLPQWPRFRPRSRSHRRGVPDHEAGNSPPDDAQIPPSSGDPNPAAAPPPPPTPRPTPADPRR